MSKDNNKLIVKYTIGIYTLIFLIFYLIPLLVGNIYGENFRYEFILAIIVGLPYSYLVLQEKIAKNQIRKASDNFDFELNRKKEHENIIESQKAVFRFTIPANIRSDMGKSVESFFFTKEFNTAKDKLQKAKEKLSNIELFVSLLKVVALWVAAFHFFYSIRYNPIKRIEEQVVKMVEQSEFTTLQDSVRFNIAEIKSIEERTIIIVNQLENKIEQTELKYIRDSVKANHIKSLNNKRNIRPVMTRLDKIEEHLENVTLVKKVQK